MGTLIPDRRSKTASVGETLCVLHTDGSLYYEGTLTTENSDGSNGSAYNLYMANLALALNKEEPFACINQNVEYYDFRALLPDGDILYQTIDEYAHYKMTDETPIYLSGDYILTEQGNVYLLDIDNMNDKTTISLTCMYDKEDIIAIDCCETASRCLALTKDGNVISFSDLAPLNTSNWKDVIAVAQGFSYAVGLTDKGKVLYADYDAENTKAVSKEVASWKNVVQIAVYYDTIVGLKEDGSLFSSEAAGK